MVESLKILRLKVLKVYGYYKKNNNKYYYTNVAKQKKWC